jgi:hypothetical protein
MKSPCVAADQLVLDGAVYKPNMNNTFLLPPPTRLSQALKSDIETTGRPASSGISRRTFLKRTGGATVAMFLAFNTRTEAADPGHASHCPVHGSECTWVSQITVNFTSTSVPPPVPGFTATGRIFHGTLTITTQNCVRGPSTVSYPVHSGGYHNPPDSPITQGNDSTCPGGDTTAGAATNGGNVDGFPVSTPETGRGAIEIHEPGVSTGCIVFDNAGQWDAFRGTLSGGNTSSDPKTKCVHNPPNPVPISVNYAPNCQPVGNTPGQ